jgi:hypothetical protein
MAADAQLLGRVTFAKAWPSMTGNEFGDKFTMPGSSPRATRAAMAWCKRCSPSCDMELVICVASRTVEYTCAGMSLASAW